MSGAKRAAAKGAAAKGAGAKAGGRAAAKAAAPARTRAAAKAPAGKGGRAKGRVTPQTAPVKRAAGSGPAEPVVFTGRGGARVWGKNHPAAQLTERQVIRYRRLVRTGKATVGEIAAKEGCGHSRISMAVRGQTWRHLNEIEPPVTG